MPKHIRQNIKVTSFSVSVYLTLKIFIAPWGTGQLYESWSEWEPWEQSQHSGPQADSQLLGIGLSSQRREHIQNHPQPLDEKDETWEDQQKSCPICLRGTRVSQRVCGGQRTTSQSRSLPSSVWGQGLNSGCQAWPQVPSPTLSGPSTQFLNFSLQMRTIEVCGGVDGALKW